MRRIFRDRAQCFEFAKHQEARRALAQETRDADG
jgi:hypothetical protein